MISSPYQELENRRVYQHYFFSVVVELVANASNTINFLNVKKENYKEKLLFVTLAENHVFAS